MTKVRKSRGGPGEAEAVRPSRGGSLGVMKLPKVSAWLYLGCFSWSQQANQRSEDQERAQRADDRSAGRIVAPVRDEKSGDPADQRNSPAHWQAGRA